MFNQDAKSVIDKLQYIIDRFVKVRFYSSPKKIINEPHTVEPQTDGRYMSFLGEIISNKTIHEIRVFKEGTIANPAPDFAEYTIVKRPPVLPNECFVDKDNNLMFFHSSQSEGNISVSYSSIGVGMLSSALIYTHIDSNDNATETLLELTRKCQKELDRVTTITDAEQLKIELKSYIETLVELMRLYPNPQSIIEDLAELVALADDLKIDLNISIEEAKRLMTELKEGSNKAKVISPVDWILVESGKYKYEYIHGLGTMNLIVETAHLVNGVLTSSTCDYEIPSANKIVFYSSDNRITLRVIVNASYYMGTGGGSSEGNVVVNADNVLDGIDKVSMTMEERKTLVEVEKEVMGARGSEKVLVDRLNKKDEQLNKVVNIDIPKINSDLADISTTYVNIINYKNLIEGTDYTKALIKALTDCANGSVIKFPTGKIIELSEIPKIEKGVVIDFNGCTIKAKTNNVIFTLGIYDTTGFVDRIKLLNYSFVQCEGYTPRTIIEIDGAINSTLQGSFDTLTTTHSIIHNKMGYGNKFLGEARYNKTPRVLYFTHHTATEDAPYSFDFYVDMDISGNMGYDNNGGLGIEYEGGTGYITGVVEHCYKGGIYYNGSNTCFNVLIENVHFEMNGYDVKVGTDESTNYSRNTGTTSIKNCFTLHKHNNFKSIIYGSYQTISIENHSSFFGGTGCLQVDKLTSDTKATSLNIRGDGSRYANLSYDGKNAVTIVSGSVVKVNDFGMGSVVGQNYNTFNSARQLKMSVGDGSRALLFEQNSLTPGTTNTFELGAKWNQYRNVYTQGVVLQNPNNNKFFRITVSGTGVLETTEIV